MADGGTIFLDEIGDMPLELQPKLLRVLQEREFDRVGSVETLKLEARVIAATNRNLETLVAARKFREDLYFRLSVIPIQLPALRERRDDIGELTDYFVSKAVQEMGARAATISPEARMKLESALAGQRARTRKRRDARGAARARHHDSRRQRRAPRPGGAGARDRLRRPTALRSAISSRDASRDGSIRPAARTADLYHRLVAEIERPLVDFALKAPAATRCGRRGCLGSTATRCARKSPTTRSSEQISRG